jgi:hypothetical protein
MPPMLFVPPVHLVVPGLQLGAQAEPSLVHPYVQDDVMMAGQEPPLQLAPAVRMPPEQLWVRHTFGG